MFDTELSFVFYDLCNIVNIVALLTFYVMKNTPTLPIQLSLEK